MFDYLHGAAKFVAPTVLIAGKLYQSCIRSQGKPGSILARQGNFASRTFRTALDLNNGKSRSEFQPRVWTSNQVELQFTKFFQTARHFVAGF